MAELWRSPLDSRASHMEGTPPTKMKKRTVISIAACLAGLPVLGWFLWPSMVVGSLAFVEKKGEEPSRRACDRIVAVGPRVIPAVIRSLKRHGPWSRRYCYLPIALAKLGEPSRLALLEAIHHEPDTLVRLKLISALHTAFDDFRFLDIVIEDAQAGRIAEYTLGMVGINIRIAFRDAPPFDVRDSSGRTINPAFVAWWARRSDGGD